MGRSEDKRIECLRDDERTPCERYTRIMGYHRPIDYANPGKQQEHRDRRFFNEPTNRSFDAMASSERNV